MKKVEEMLLEQEKMRIPVAQGLPWTTDEPEVKPHLIFPFFFFNKSCLLYWKHKLWKNMCALRKH